MLRAAELHAVVERCGIAAIAAGPDLGATDPGIERRLGPGDRAIFSHGYPYALGGVTDSVQILFTSAFERKAFWASVVG